MLSFDVTTSIKVNEVDFFTSQKQVRTAFGLDYEAYPKVMQETEESKAKYDSFAARLAKLAGKSVEDFLNGIPTVKQAVFDKYSFGKIYYNDSNQFEAIEIQADKEICLIIDQHDCSDFKLESFKKLTDDFRWDKLNTSWISVKKQISLYCPEKQTGIENVLIGCKNYFKGGE